MEQAPRIRISLVAGRKEDKQALSPEEVQKQVAAAIARYEAGMDAIKKEFGEGLDTSK